jgi:hypothetical protein
MLAPRLDNLGGPLMIFAPKLMVDKFFKCAEIKILSKIVYHDVGYYSIDFIIVILM